MKSNISGSGFFFLFGCFFGSGFPPGLLDESEHFVELPSEAIDLPEKLRFCDNIIITRSSDAAYGKSNQIHEEENNRVSDLDNGQDSLGDFVIGVPMFVHCKSHKGHPKEVTTVELKQKEKPLYKSVPIAAVAKRRANRTCCSKLTYSVPQKVRPRWRTFSSLQRTSGLRNCLCKWPSK